MKSIFRKLAVFVLVMGVVTVAGWYGRKIYKKATERRLVAEAREFLEKRDVRNATLCLQRALQVNPMSVEACVLTAEMLDGAASPAAITWRIRAAQLRTNNVKFRFDWAATALKLQDHQSAEQALSGIDEKHRQTAEYQKLAGTLAWSQRNPAEAEDHFRQAQRLDPTNQTVSFNLATIQLLSTNVALADQARAELQRIPTNSPLRAVALRRLIGDALSHNLNDRAIALSSELLAAPDSVFADKIAHLEILRQQTSPLFAPYRASIEQCAKTNVDQAYALGRWIAQSQATEAALKWVDELSEVIQTNQPLPILKTDCLIALARWKDLSAFVGKKDWKEAEYFRLAVESLANRQLGNEAASQAAWQKTMRLSGQRLDLLTRLSQILPVWGWRAETTDVLSRIALRFRTERWAYDRVVSELYAQGNTEALAEFLKKMHSADPQNEGVKNNLAMVELLRKTDLNSAHKMAREVFEGGKENPFYISTFAYSQLLQNQVEQARKTIESIKPDYLKIPSIATYYGLVQAQAGNKEAAADSLKIADKGRMLPEERELVKLAMASVQ